MSRLANLSQRVLRAVSFQKRAPAEPVHRPGPATLLPHLHEEHPVRHDRHADSRSAWGGPISPEPPLVLAWFASQPPRRPR